MKRSILIFGIFLSLGLLGQDLSEQVDNKIRKAVIDAGHGGKDPGAIGVTGLKEKIVVLKLAKKIARYLEEENGYKEQEEK